MLRLFILSVLIALVSSQSLSKLLLIFSYCTYIIHLVAPTFYDVKNPAPFNGSNLTTTGTNCSGVMSPLDCSVSSKLIDGDFGPMDSLTGQLGQFFGFNQNDSRLTFNIGTNNISKVVVYFFNSPTNAIGLPLIKVFTVNRTVPYFFSDNDDLAQTDSQLRAVTLQLSQEIGNFRLDFFFSSSSSIDWFLVSEVQLYSGKRINVLNLFYCIYQQVLPYLLQWKTLYLRMVITV